MLKVVFFATPEIAVPSLEYLLTKSDIEVLGVVTKIDKPSGRGHKLECPPIKICAQKNDITCFQSRLLREDKELIKTLILLKPDFFVTFAYGQILSQEILDIPKYHTINLHASLLPNYRGANPIQRAIVGGEKITGVTTMITTLELDAGDICMNKIIKIHENMTDKELSEKIADVAPELIYNSLIGLSNKMVCPLPQEHKYATFAPKFEKQDACINWNCESVCIHNLIRGLYSKPSCYTYFNEKLIKILKSKLTFADNSGYAPGTLIKKGKDGIEIATVDSTIIIETVKPEGKSEMKAIDWLNGSKMKIGDLFDCNYKKEF